MLTKNNFALLVALGACAYACGAPKPQPKAPPPKATAAAQPSKSKTAAQPQVPDVTLTLPKGFTRRTEQGVIVVSGPDPKLRIAIATPRVSSTPAAALAEVWTRFSPTFTTKPREVIKAPTPPEPYSAVYIGNYRVEADVVRQGFFGRAKDGKRYVLLVEAPLQELKKRQAQVREVWSSARPRGFSPKKLGAKDAVTLGDAHVKAIEALAEKARAAFELPGLSVVLVQDGKIAGAFGRGYLRLGDKRRKVDARTHMMVGSITKSFTALMLAKLVEEGKLSWQDPVTKHYPSLRLASAEQTKALRMWHLMCACTGVPRRDMPILFEWEHTTPKKLIAKLSTFTLLTGFGETFQYSNQLVAAAGFVAARAFGKGRGLGRRYEQLMRSRVLDPLGMKDTFVSWRRVMRARRYALPHSETIRGEVVPVKLDYERFVGPYAPAGAIWSTANDMGKLLAALTAKKRPAALPVSQLPELWKPRAKVAARASYGLGWLSGEYHGAKVHTHGGATFGFRAKLVYVPAARAGYAILTNGARGSAVMAVLEKKIMATLFSRPDHSDKTMSFLLARIAVGKKRLAERVADGVPAARAKVLVGRYVGRELGRVRVLRKGTRLLLDTERMRSAFLPLKPEPKDTHKEQYILADPPLTGVSFWVEEKVKGKPEIHLQPNTDHYVLRRR
ncbi:MAG: beta-lactamase family protein [Myxococcales bacterium]|nr:beta-lactamase family protein [Myxococcales bacterium]